MILTSFTTGIEYLLGAGIAFGLGFAMVVLCGKKTLTTFLVFSMIFAGYCAEAHLLPLWVFVALFIINIVLVGIDYSKNKGGTGIAYEYLSLTCLIGLSVLNIMFGGDWLGFSLEGDLTSSLSVDSSFAIDEFWGLLSAIITISVIGAIFGIQLFNAGLNSESVKTLIIAISYIGLWGLFSLLSYDLIMSIPVFGAIIWFLLTFVYALGIVKKITGGNE